MFRLAILTLAAWLSAAPLYAFAPAPLPKRPRREPADPVEASYARLLSAIKHGRSEHVALTLPVGRKWAPPLFPRDVSAFGLDAGKRGVRLTASGDRGPYEVTGLGEGAATLTFDFRGEATFRVTVVLTFVQEKKP